MEDRKLAGSENRTRFNVDLYNQWPGLFDSESNWYDFTLIQIEGEYSPYKSSAEIVLGLLGFKIIFTYTYSFDFIDRMTSLKDETLAAFDATHPSVKVEDPFGVLDKLDENESN